MTNNNHLVIIGAGAAGIMAAISARKVNSNIRITILEKNEKIGKKILICGAGRCNVTNSDISIDRYYGAPTKFISTVLNQFGSRGITEFLNELGVELYEEEKNGRKKGKIFPITDQASTIVDLLDSELKRLKINLNLNCEVTDVVRKDGVFEVTSNQGEFSGDKLVLACGGLTYPKLGGTGTGYEIAKKFGHSIVEPVPSALPLETEHWMITRLMGVRHTIEVTSIINNKEIKKDTDEVMFTKYGLSGPAILNISREISVSINRDKNINCKLRLNLFPGKSFDQVHKIFSDRWLRRPDQEVLFSLYGVLPNKIALAVLNFLNIAVDTHNSELSKKTKADLINQLTNWEVVVDGTRSWDEGEFTAGGVNVKEVKAETLESKIVPNLYLVGEVLNVDGDVGGFNLTWAWSSGWVAGKSIR